MTYKEAIEELKDRYMGRSCFASKEDCIKANEALDMAIEALETQIPKETLKKKNVHGEFEYFCPTCDEYCGYKGLQSLGGISYCGNCGQCLDYDWSEE